MKSFLIVLTFSLCSCQQISLPKEGVIDQKFNDYFHLDGEGFTGGDGTYSVQLPDGRNVWIFGDTFIGAVNEDNTRTKTDPIYIRNCFLLQDGDDFKFLYGDSSEVNRSLIIPPQVVRSGYDTSEYEQWYWPGDAFVINDELKVFVSEFHQIDTGMWGFSWKGSAIASFSLPDFRQIGIERIPYGLQNGVHYGHALLEQGNSIYIYGLKNGRAHVAKAMIEDATSNWKFFNGESWSEDAKESKEMADIDGSEQFSVFEDKGTFYYLTQKGSLSPEISVYRSDLPYTGWKDESKVYSTPIDTLNQNLFTYNALAHPQFVDDKGMLISYNTNSFKLEDHYKDASIYRPRFVRVKIDDLFSVKSH